MHGKCNKCGSTDNYNFVINNGMCNPCIEGLTESLQADLETLKADNERLKGELKEEKHEHQYCLARFEEVQENNGIRDKAITDLEAELATEKSLRGSIESSHFRINDAGTVAIGTCGEFNCYPAEDGMVKIYTTDKLRGVYFNKYTIQKLIILLGQVRNYMWKPLPAQSDKPETEEPRAGGFYFCDKCKANHNAIDGCPKPEKESEAHDDN